MRKLKETVHPRSIIAYTDGSEKEGHCSFAAILYTTDGKEITRDNGRISAKKTILDAEATAIYHAMLLAMNTPTDLTVHQRETERILRHVIILSDSKAAIHEITEPRYKGPRAYLNSMRVEVETHPERHNTAFHIGWIKGHLKIEGNEAADRHAKAATITKDPYPDTNPTFLTRHTSGRRQKEWEEWYDSRKHEYLGRPTRRLKKHIGLSRLDSTILFKIRCNKGWKPDDRLGVADPPGAAISILGDCGAVV